MIERMVTEIQNALDNDLFMVALCTALTLPDICGKVAFPNYKNWKRYIDWYDTEITSRGKQCEKSDDMPEVNGSVVYSLRCSLLHEGNPNIDNEQLAKNNTKPIDRFILTMEHSAPIIFPIDYSKISADGTRTYSMSIRGLCYTICDAAERFYKENKDKFNFNYELEDTDEKLRDIREFASLFPLWQPEHLKK